MDFFHNYEYLKMINHVLYVRNLCSTTWNFFFKAILKK